MAVALDFQPVYIQQPTFVSKWMTSIIACSLLLAVLCAKVWIKLDNIQLGYEIAQERDLTVTLDMERRDLELQKSILLRPDMLRERAKHELQLEELDMRFARKVKY